MAVLARAVDVIALLDIDSAASDISPVALPTVRPKASPEVLSIADCATKSVAEVASPVAVCAFTEEKPAVTFAVPSLSTVAEGATSSATATPSVRLLPVSDVDIVAVLAVAEAVTALLSSEIVAPALTVEPAAVAAERDIKGSVTVALAVLPKASFVVSSKVCTLVCATTASSAFAPATIKLPVFLLPVVVAEIVLLVAEIATVSASPVEDRVMPSSPLVSAMIDESTLFCTLLTNRSALSTEAVALAESRLMLSAAFVALLPSTLRPSATNSVLVDVFCAAEDERLFWVSSTDVVSRSPVTVAAIPEVEETEALVTAVVPEVPTLSATWTLEMPAVLDRVARPPSSTYSVFAADAPVKAAEIPLLSSDNKDVSAPPVTSKLMSELVTVENAVALTVFPAVSICTSLFNCVDCTIRPPSVSTDPNA